MIKHIFKLIWNKKGSNALMILEILLSFLVLFAVLSYVLYNFGVFNKPLGFETKNRLVVNLDDLESKDSIEAYNILTSLDLELPLMDRIEGVSFTGGIVPFQGSTWQTGGTGDDGLNLQVRVVMADHNFADVMGITVTDGRWFAEGEENEAMPTTLVNHNFVDKYYPGQDVLGKVIKLDGEVKIIGVYEDFRYMGEFEQDEITVFYHQNPRINSVQRIMLALEPGTPASYEEDIFKVIESISKSSSFTIQDLDEERVSLAKETWIPVIALLAMCGFLCLNVALGLFGVLWYNINKRRPEIGLRRALGAHSSDIRFHFVFEILVLTLIGIGIGTFFAIQVPLLKAVDIDHSIFYKSIIYAAVTIIVIVLLCALYPSSQASRISPSIALHED